MIEDFEALNRADRPDQFVQISKTIVDAELTSLKSQIPVWKAADQIQKIANYAIFAGGGGKRIRPALALLTARCLGTPYESVIEAAAAIELIHTYTIIIDDIQDNDDLRRGEPATHVKYGLNLSLLAASTLLFEGTTRLQQHLKLPPHVLRQILHKLHAGQEADILSDEWTTSERTVESIQFIFSGKTGALFELSCIAGLGDTTAKLETVDKLREIGGAMGVLFQAVDDYLEIKGDEVSTGKPVGKNRGNKLTYVSMFPSIDDAWIGIKQQRNALEDKIRAVFPSGGADRMVKFLAALVERSR
jgi:geranylgeranyl pyrophosphate synthase